MTSPVRVQPTWTGSSAARKAGVRRPTVSVNKRLVRERDPDRARELARFLTLGVAILVPLLLHVWQQVAFVETMYEVDGLKDRQVRLERLLRVERMERAMLESPDRIEREASRRLGMVFPAAEEVVLIEADKDGNRKDTLAPNEEESAP